MKITVATRTFVGHEIQQLLRQMLRCCNKMLNEDVFAESSRLFSIACLVASQNEIFTELDFDDHSTFRNTFETLSGHFEVDLKHHESVEAEDEPIYFLQASISYLKLVYRSAENTFKLITLQRLAAPLAGDILVVIRACPLFSTYRNSTDHTR